jgi:cytochrome c
MGSVRGRMDRMPNTLLRFAIVTLTLSITGQEAVLAEGSAISRGESLVSQHCAMCHAIGRSETSPNAMARPFRLLGGTVSIESLEESLRNGALLGHPMMPGFAFSPGDASAIVRYLQSIQSR